MGHAVFTFRIEYYSINVEKTPDKITNNAIC